MLEGRLICSACLLAGDHANQRGNARCEVYVVCQKRGHREREYRPGEEEKQRVQGGDTGILHVYIYVR